MTKRQRKDKWVVYGEYAWTFTNLKDAKRCAKEESINQGYADVTLIEDGCHYIDYENGKCIRDGWTIKR